MRFGLGGTTLELSLGRERTGQVWLFIDRVVNGQPADNPDQWELDSTDITHFSRGVEAALAELGLPEGDAAEVAETFSSGVWPQLRPYTDPRAR
jgi:hypothetical protein